MAGHAEELPRKFNFGLASPRFIDFNDDSDPIGLKSLKYGDEGTSKLYEKLECFSHINK